jgi:small-conductance mechanosensitive channel
MDKRASESFSKVSARTIQYIIYISGIYIGIYYILGLNLTAIATSLGIISIAIAFSSQQITQNAIAGVLMGFQRQIQIQEWVQIGSLDITQVKDLTLTRTVLRDINGRLIFIPNYIVLSSNIINYSRSGYVKSSITISLTVKSGLSKAKDRLMKACMDYMPIIPGEVKSESRKFRLQYSKKIKPDNFMPRILLADVSKDNADFMIEFWINDITKKQEIISGLLEKISRSGVDKG